MFHTRVLSSFFPSLSSRRADSLTFVESREPIIVASNAAVIKPFAFSRFHVEKVTFNDVTSGPRFGNVKTASRGTTPRGGRRRRRKSISDIIAFFFIVIGIVIGIVVIVVGVISSSFQRLFVLDVLFSFFLVSVIVLERIFFVGIGRPIVA